MNLPVGVAVLVVVMVGLPLGAVAVGRRWRDPPPEKWPISQRARHAAANTPELIAYRRRIELGVADPRTEAVVDRAIRTGTAAPPPLRAATRELARLRIAEIEHRLRHTRFVFGFWLVSTVALAAIGIYATVRHGAWFVLLYSLFWVPRAYLYSPWYARRLRGRAEAAVLANAEG